MKMRRLISAIIALLLVVNLSVTAFAAEWYLEDGDITVSAGDSGQTVSQGSSTDVADNAPVIKQRDSSKTTDSTITISTSDNATANVTIQDINISSTGDAIDVGSSSANITLEGDNKIFSESGSALHVSDGDVTTTYIKGAKDIRFGVDIKGGVNVTFVPSDGYDATDEQLDAARLVIENRLVCLLYTSPSPRD